MNLREAENLIAASLKDIYELQEASAVASLALEHITSLSRRERVFKKDEILTAGQQEALGDVMRRLLEHEPVQYIMNKAWFYGLELYVDRDVLIPRPETEELVDWIAKDIKLQGLPVFEKKADEADETTRLKILDVGTGSGCIALALKKAMPLAEVWGCDISDRALNIARRNGSELNIRVDFQPVDFLDSAQRKHLPSVDIVVSNPPYVPLANKADMRPNVLLYEPHTALFVDDKDSLVFYTALAQFGHQRLHAGGRIYAEIHEDLGDRLKELFEKQGYDVEIRPDMQGKQRLMKAWKPNG